ncbi:serine/threonine-protein phosphatase 6 regulatory ankyrin repeat subunit C-like isoform X2 [Corticium candelabrum]|nr:serine/threonine-protein phosphatase 6 regulatory ankyrin repeat subunit C-like isoform X2 [Corticium candelabrum]
MTGSEDTIDVLLNVKDINVMSKDFWGRTAIHYASEGHHVTIVERLLSCSVPVDINDNDGHTPLLWAACNGDVGCVDVLLKHGASPQHESKYGSPLEIAKHHGYSDVVEMMEEAIRLRSHPYVKRDVAIRRQEDDQTIAELQREVKMLKGELRQSVHKSEVTKLRTEIQEKEEKMRYLVSALATVSEMASKKVTKSHVTSKKFLLSTQPAEDVMYAVSALACDQWSDVGLELGYTMPELNSLTSSVTALSSKLHAILRTKALAVGTSKVVGIILSACQRINLPICAAAIRDEVVKRQKRLKAQNDGQ